MKCPNCHSEAVYQLDDPYGTIVCITCGSMASWKCRYRLQLELQAVQDRVTIAQLELDQLRAKMSGKVALDKG